MKSAISAGSLVGVALSFFGSGQAAAETETSARPPIFEATLGVGVLSRAQNFADTLPERIPSGSASGPVNGSLPAGVAPFVAASYYPLADGRSFLGNLGIVGSFEVLAVGSIPALHSDLFGKEVDVNYYRYTGGFRGRLPIERAELGLSARYAGQDFSSKNALDRSGREIYAKADFAALEFLFDALYRVDALAIGAYFGYLAPLSLGRIASDAWFPNARGFGLAGGGHVSYFFAENFGLSLLLDTRAYGFDFNPVEVRNPPEFDRVAGGMTDRYVSMSIGLTFRLSPEKEPALPTANAQPKPAEDKKTDSFDSFD